LYVLEITRELFQFVNESQGKELTAEGTVALQYCPYLTELDLGHCKNIDDDALRNVARYCPRLETLDLWWCLRCTDESILAVAQGLPLLSRLYLSGKKNFCIITLFD